MQATNENYERIEQPMLEMTDVLTGYFSFQKEGKQYTDVPFYVRCEARPDRTNPNFESIKDRRNDAANDQLTDAYFRLRGETCCEIHYKEVHPNPYV